MQARDLAGHVQPDSKTADVMRLCILSPIKTGEQLRQGSIRNAYSLVGYGNARYALLAHQANHDIAQRRISSIRRMTDATASIEE